MSALIALIGHSASGKSSCIEGLGFSLEVGDMDRALKADVAPSVDAFREWLSKEAIPLVVALSIHTDKLQEYYRAARELGVLLVYLRKSKERIAEHVKLQQPHGEFRPPEHQHETIRSYPEFDTIFRTAADRIIDCSDKNTAEVANEVRRILDQILQRRFSAVTPSNADVRISSVDEGLRHFYRRTA